MKVDAAATSCSIGSRIGEFSHVPFCVTLTTRRASDRLTPEEAMLTSVGRYRQLSRLSVARFTASTRPDDPNATAPEEDIVEDIVDSMAFYLNFVFELD
jgi:hypothetical protein